jgi:hypothetical protein
LQSIAYVTKRSSSSGSLFWLRAIPAPPGAIGSIMRLQWREMLRTLDPYLAFILMACTEFYRLSGKPLDPAAPRILALLVALALSTETQVLFGIDGQGAERYRHFPIRGWQILLAKDLAVSGAAQLPRVAARLNQWLFRRTGSVGRRPSSLSAESGCPDSLEVHLGRAAVRWSYRDCRSIRCWTRDRTQGMWLASLCVAAWTVSMLFYGWLWDRRKLVAY